MSDMQKLLDIMARLRDPEKGCPWDLRQSFQTIVPHTLEEAYEVATAIEQNDYDNLLEELGDLLFQIVFYARLAEEEKRFNFDDVVEVISEKLIRRHPHVFADQQFASVEEQTAHWEATKAQERAAKKSVAKKNKAISQLDGVAKNLPALSAAQKLQSRAARVGFDWPSADGVFDKFNEELEEIKQAWDDEAARMEEIGDLLFTSVNLSRHAGVDPEQALRYANRKFTERFCAMERLNQLTGGELSELTPETWESLWQQAKHQ